MRRIIVAGGQGSGKTRLSRALGAKLDLSVIHLDTLYWRPGWKPSDREDFRARVALAIAGDGWVADGSFSGLAMDLTLARADRLIVIERPRGCGWDASCGAPSSSATGRAATCPRAVPSNSTGPC